MPDDTFFGWLFDFFSREPLEAIQFVILLFIFPLLLLAERVYVRKNQVSLSNMIFGEGNEWAQGKKTGIASDIVFSGFLGMIGARWLLEKWMRLWNWSEPRVQKRRELMLESAIFYRHVMTGDNFSKLKKAHPLFIWINYAFLLACLIIVLCVVLASYFGA